MRNVLAGALVVVQALALVAATVCFGAVTVELAAPLYGIATLLAILWAAKLFLGGDCGWKHSPLHLPVLAFLGYTALRYATSPIEYEARMELFQVALFSLVYFTAASNFHRPRDRSILIGTIAFLALGEAAYGIWQFATGAPTVLHLEKPAGYLGRASGTYICPNHFAGFLEMALALLLARAALARHRSDPLDRGIMGKVLLVYVILMAVVGIVVSFSRAGWLATLAAVASFSLWGRWRLQEGWARIALVVAALTVMGVLAVSLPRVQMRLDRLREQPAGDRVHMWRATLAMIGEHPFFGTGPGSWQYFHLAHRHPVVQSIPEYTHNDLLNLVSDYGLVGLVLVGMALGCFFWHVTVASRETNRSEARSFAVGSGSAAVAILAHSLVDFNLHIPANALVLVTLMGFTAALDDPARRFPRTPMRPVARYALGLFLLLLGAAAVWFIGPAALAGYHLTRGNEAKRALDYNAAVSHFERARALDPKNPEPYTRLGEVYQTHSKLPHLPERDAERKEMLEYAIERFRGSRALNPYQARVWVRLAGAYEQAGNNERAQNAYESALLLDPNNAFIHFQIGKFYRDRGDTNRAAQAFAKSMSINSTADRSAQRNLIEMFSLDQAQPPALNTNPPPNDPARLDPERHP